MVGEWRHYLPIRRDSKISFFGPRGVFFQTFLSFQDLLSLFKMVVSLIGAVEEQAALTMSPRLFIEELASFVDWLR